MSDMPRASRLRPVRFVAELIVIFVGVSSAFVVENYRERQRELEELDQAVDGIIFELGHYSTRTVVHAEGVTDAISRWQTEDAAGRRAIPGDYTIPGALRPPTPAWETTVASGTANLLEPSLRMDLGWFYNEFLGIHANHARHVEFSEQEILPRAVRGADAFYGPDGELLPEFVVHMELLSEFGTGLTRMARWADSLQAVLTRTRGR